MLNLLASIFILHSALASFVAPHGSHLSYPCTIPRFNGDLPIDAFRSTYKGRLPVVFSCRGCRAANMSTTSSCSAPQTSISSDPWSALRPPVGTASAALAALMERDFLLSTHSEVPVVLASSDSYSSDKRETTFADYITSHVDVPVDAGKMAADSWYLFGDSQGIEHWDMLADAYRPLPLDSATDDGLAVVGVGGKYSGVAFHTHGAAFAETIIGAKRWFLSPPNARPVFKTDRVQANWTLEWEARMGSENTNSRLPNDDAIIECTLGAGEIIYIPPNWWHATLNLGTYNAFVSTFTQEKFDSH